ncbi:MAG: paraquat-inducible protein A [bacterium]
MVFLTTLLAPALHVRCCSGWSCPDARPPLARGAQAFRFLQSIRPWSMAEVFMLGVLVSMVKLADLAVIVPGIALWAFAALIPVLAASMVTLDAEETWRTLAPEVRAMTMAIEQHLATCHACGLLQRLPAGRPRRRSLPAVRRGPPRRPTASSGPGRSWWRRCCCSSRPTCCPSWRSPPWGRPRPTPS